MQAAPPFTEAGRSFLHGLNMIGHTASSFTRPCLVPFEADVLILERLHDLPSIFNVTGNKMTMKLLLRKVHTVKQSKIRDGSNCMRGNYDRVVQDRIPVRLLQLKSLNSLKNNSSRSGNQA